MKLAVLFKVILGFVALSLAFVGILLPIWPTTPFVLLAIGCFSSTPKLRAKLLRISLFREYYESYTAGKSIRRKTVVGSLAFLWVMLAVSMALIFSLWSTLLLFAVGTAVTLHILFIAKGREKQKRKFAEDEDANN